MARFRMVATVAMLPGLLCGGSALSLSAPTSAAIVADTRVTPSVDPTPSAAPSASGTPTVKPPGATPSPSARPTPPSPPKVAPKVVPQKPSVPAPRPAFRFPVPVTVSNASQVITVAARGSYATVTAWQHSASGWRSVLSTSVARVGANGVVAAAVRRQGTNTTPGGTFTLTEAFGIAANPGAHLSYHRVTADDWWVEDNNSAYYNQLRTASAGGFDMSLPESDVNGSERLITHTTAYQYALVINYNRWPAVHYKGAGIFLHVNGAGATAGCVSVPTVTLVALLRWLDPAQHPRIAIG